ncbi:methyltransferase family protein [Asanoa ferruginea]|uniref:Methyltransferase family protein n=1 Tax=Asanoa ferruginea TaxID=53367 RepID=A0A3D9ZVI0_9ACTN|nr:class I SAM-dependent methyltransferase [Asanoa ferruginea]REG00960.1 methyltransferase family protein [Asanoa ferruginea]
MSITEAGLAADDAIIDVGAGASVLVDQLLQAGYSDVTTLDVAGDALAVSRERLGTDADRVDWIVGDVLTWQPTRRFQLWHDRAVFHFLTNPADRDRYRQVLQRALAPDGHVVIGAFAEDGPPQCSGLPTARHTIDQLAAQFPGFHLVKAVRNEHHTPAGGVQSFNWVLLTERP